MNRDIDPWLCREVVKRQHIAYALADENLTILSSNPAMNSWAESPDLVDRFLPDLLPELVGVEQILRGLLDSKDDDAFTIPTICRILPNGLPGYFDLRVEPIYESRTLLVMVSDVTKQVEVVRQLQQERKDLHVSYIHQLQKKMAGRKLAKEELSAYREQLEQLVAKRTAKLEEANQQLRQEIRERKRVERALTTRLDLENMVVGLSTKFITLPYTEIDQTITQALKTIAQFVGANRASLFLYHDNLTLVSNTHEWCAEASDSQIEVLQNLPVETFGYYWQLLQRKETVIINCLDDLPLEAHDERTWIKLYGFRSLLFVPMLFQDTLFGTVGFYGQMGEERDWPAPFVLLLKFVADIFVNALQRKEAEKMLRERRESLERANKELEQFAYVASHDLQEPLRSVVGYLQLLERRYKGQLGADADKFITRSVAGAKRMQTLINDLLSYSRVGTRGQAFTSTDLSAVLNRAQANLYGAISSSQAVITHDPLPTLKVDGLQLVQLFQNLLSNAIKFHRKQPPKIHIGVQERDNECLFSVQDNGVGIDADFSERIFLIFQRLHTKRDYPGNGIGLAICQKIVQRHGGRIWFESEVGAGSTFYFTISYTCHV
ncbi:MAG: ATP-binding protein [Ardenticatenaceae bacterium]